MGNTQSAEAPRKPRTKLTKPRTNTSTSNLLTGVPIAPRRNSKLDLPVPLSKRSSVISIDDVNNDDDASLSYNAASLTRRQTLFGPTPAAIDLSLHTEQPADDVQEYSASNPLQRYHSVGPTIANLTDHPHHWRGNTRLPLRATRSTANHYSQAQHVARLSLVVESQTPRPNVPEEVKQLGLQTANLADEVHKFPAPIEHSRLDETIPIPIRRRSLLVPGIATRGSWKDDTPPKLVTSQSLSALTSLNSFAPIDDSQGSEEVQPLQSSASQARLGPYHYDRSKRMSSPLENLAALRVPRDMEQPRTATPCDLDYRHTGAFKLGSLRITNGAASPAPSGKETHLGNTRFPINTKVDDPHSSGGLTPKQAEEYSQGGLYRGPTHNLSGVDNKDRGFSRDVPEMPPKVIETMVEIPGYSLGWSGIYPDESQSNVEESPTLSTAYDLARAYMKDIAPSPFSFEETPPTTPQLQATSKKTATEDNLFDDESESLDSLDPSSPGECTLEGSSVPAILQVGRPPQVHPPYKIKGPREQAPKPLEKADSGYSSKTSLRSFRSAKSNIEARATSQEPPAPSVPNKSPPRPPPKTIYSKNSYGACVKSSTVQGVHLLDGENAAATAGGDWLPPTSKSAKNVFENAGASCGNQSRLSYATFQPRRTEPSPVLPQKSLASRTRRSGPPPLPIKSIEQTQAAARIPADIPATLSSTATTQQQIIPIPNFTSSSILGLQRSESDTSLAHPKRKLQKQRATREASPVVQGYTEIKTATIPPVSQDAADRLEERLKNFPTLAHTYRSIHRTGSKETLATIFSGASIDIRAEEITAPARYGTLVPNAQLIEDIEHPVAGMPGHTSPPPERVSVKTKFWRRSLDAVRNRRRSMDSINQDCDLSETHPAQRLKIEDLGTVSKSLGASTYELATGTLPSHQWQSPAKNFAESLHKPRGRTIGMDSNSAVHFARGRSRLLRHHSFEDRALSANQSESLATVPAWNNPNEMAPPVPCLPLEEPQGRPGYKRMKSGPPVSMKAQWTPATNLPEQPSRAAPGLLANSLQSFSPQIEQTGLSIVRAENEWEKQGNSWRGRRQSANEMFQKRSVARRSLESSANRDPTPSLVQYPHQARSPVTSTRPPPTHQSRSYSSLLAQNEALARQSFDSLQPRPQTRTLARSSFDSVTTSANPGTAYALSHSNSLSHIPSPPALTVDRYNAGFGYSYEPGQGIGGSAGTRNGVTAASRKAVEGSIRWGVDLSDVPIIVMQGPRGLQV